MVIVEGTCGSGKTTLLRSVESFYRDRIRVLPQRTTYAPIAAREDDRTLDDTYNRNALLDVVRRIATDVDSQRWVLVDTLHATHFVRARALSISSFIEIDRALNELGAMVVILRIDEDAIRTRTIVCRRGTGFYEYARKFGDTENERARYFVQEQEQLIELLATHSCLPQLILDGSESRDALLMRFSSVVHLDGEA